jgi:hypothetical protein
MLSCFNIAAGANRRPVLRLNHIDSFSLCGGKSEPYDQFPFSIPTFELRYEAVGEVDSQLETFADWKQPRSRCIALECVEASTGRAEIDRAPGPFNSENLKGRLPASRGTYLTGQSRTSYEHAHKS